MPKRKEIAVRSWVIENHVEPRIVPSPHIDAVRDAVEELDPEDQYVILRYFYERMTLSDIATTLALAGRTSGHYRVQRALDTLREKLAEKGITDQLWE